MDETDRHTIFSVQQTVCKICNGDGSGGLAVSESSSLMDHADGRQASLFRLIPVRSGISGWGCRQADVQRRGLAQQCCEEVTKRIANTNHSQL
jgi:hypothetical protein